MSISPSNDILVTTNYAKDITRNENNNYLNSIFPIDITNITLSTQNIDPNDITDLPNASQIVNNDIELAYPELQVEKKQVRNIWNRCNVYRQNSLTIKFFLVISIITVMLYFTFYKK